MDKHERIYLLGEAGKELDAAREILERKLRVAKEQAKAAHAEGIPITHISDYTGISRVTIYKLINEED